MLTKKNQEIYLIWKILQDLIISIHTRPEQFMKWFRRKKPKLVEAVYKTAHPRTKGDLFYHLSDGRWKSRNPDFYANSREELVEKLYEYFFVHTFEEVYLEWVDMRIRHGVKSNKTIQEDLSMLKNVFKNEPIAEMQISDIKKRDIKYMYERWTGPGLITRKASCKRISFPWREQDQFLWRS